MQQFVRLLQIAALVLLPLSMVLQIAGTITVGQMLIAMVAGFCLFWIGRILEGHLRT